MARQLLPAILLANSKSHLTMPWELKRQRGPCRNEQRSGLLELTRCSLFERHHALWSFTALATDYYGTHTDNGKVDGRGCRGKIATVEYLRAWRLRGARPVSNSPWAAEGNSWLHRVFSHLALQDGFQIDIFVSCHGHQSLPVANDDTTLYGRTPPALR
jgi:hypothetical protein